VSALKVHCAPVELNIRPLPYGYEPINIWPLRGEGTRGGVTGVTPVRQVSGIATVPGRVLWGDCGGSNRQHDTE
jgi:hypothetical protein